MPGLEKIKIIASGLEMGGSVFVRGGDYPAFSILAETTIPGVVR